LTKEGLQAKAAGIGRRRNVVRANQEKKNTNEKHAQEMKEICSWSNSHNGVKKKSGKLN